MNDLNIIADNKSQFERECGVRLKSVVCDRCWAVIWWNLNKGLNSQLRCDIGLRIMDGLDREVSRGQ